MANREAGDQVSDATSRHPSHDANAKDPSVTLQVDPDNTRAAPSDVPPPPPPPPPPAQEHGNPQHPIIGIMRDQELGKAILAYTIPIAMALLASGKNTLAPPEMTLILIALSVGCAAIWNGILLRKTFAKAAQFVEQLGVCLVFLSFNGLIALLLPPEFRWVPALCMVALLLPFVVAARGQPPPKN